MSIMLDTLPQALTDDIRAFCKTISPSTPRFITSKPDPDAVPSHCFDNVARRVSSKGGKLVHGWAVWHFRSAYFEAEHHGIWQLPDGEWSDVSPQPNDAGKLLFLEDIDAPFDPAVFRSNVIAPEPGSIYGPQIVRLARRRNQILDSYRAPDVIVPQLTPGDQAELLLIGAGLSLRLGMVAVSNRF